jgi:hypothetical protein
METATDSELSNARETPVLQWSGQRRFKYFVTGVVGPVGCLVLAWLGINARVTGLWQSGSLETYLKLMLEPAALLPFIPLLVFSMLTLGCCCVRPQLAKKLWVRVGVYGGGILSTQYLVFAVFAGAFIPFICAFVVGPMLALLTYVAAKLMPRARRITILQIMLLTAVVAVLATVCIGLTQRFSRNDEVAEVLFGGLFWITLATPVLNCITYVRATFAILRSPALESLPRTEQRKLFGLSCGWLLGFGASWKFALDAMLTEYAKLPTSPPKCYVSSAAAAGHPRFVGVAQFSVFAGDAQLHRDFPLNLQMCRLKFLEFALAAFSPVLHRRIRYLYDSLGPPAAAVCRSNVWLADASYIALKPVELLAYLAQVLSGVSSRRVRAIYGQR